ncbi:phosphopantetheine-binding protein [Nocardia goodfellowii]|uniref:Acyl carrier protein n=1 Tax=Nocardia goodfellowii TaxID=882446 RepID=A0ABS4QIN5_9NOCA|nr:phosphopantetheine-binding protein [Nocardia goodfellowii]MBP2191562.1 acyl carrier protein [Nocardia goodfellowii]
MANETPTFHIVRQRLSEVLQIDETAIEPEAMLLALPGVDSLRLVEVVVRVENDLGVSLLNQEESLLKVRTVADLADLAELTERSR